jgi:hypothetical protein
MCGDKEINFDAETQRRGIFDRIVRINTEFQARQGWHIFRKLALKNSKLRQERHHRWMTGICRSYGAKSLSHPMGEGGRRPGEEFIILLWFYKYVAPDGAGELVLPVCRFAGNFLSARRRGTREKVLEIRSGISRGSHQPASARMGNVRG